MSSLGPHVAGEPYTATQAAEHLRCSYRWVIPADVVERGLPTKGTSTPAVAEMYGVATAAERLGLQVRTVQRLAAGGEFAGACKQQGFWYIPSEAIEARLARRPRD